MWGVQNGHLLLTSETNTDFWQKTHYGFSADNGHFLQQKLTGNFQISTRISVNYLNQYDQAGLMVRISEDCWIKTAIEFEPEEENKLGAVVTRFGYSDWSTQNISKEVEDFKLRLTRQGSDYIVESSIGDNHSWEQLRMFHLEDQEEVSAGVYACSPKKGGFTAQFHYLEIEKIKNE
jgi:hypothetical protein